MAQNIVIIILDFRGAFQKLKPRIALVKHKKANLKLI